VKSKTWGAVLGVFIILGTIIGSVYAGTLAVNDIFGFTNGYGFTWLNSTNIIADTYYFGADVNLTEWVENQIAAIPAPGGGGSGIVTTSDLLCEIGGLYYSFNGTSGENYSSPNPTNILKWTIGNATIGQNIYIRVANWTISAKITIATEGLTIEGEGEGTLIQAAKNLNDDMFLVSADYVTFRHLKFDGNKDNNLAGSVIELSPGNQYFEYDNNHMVNATAHPINIVGTDLAPSLHAHVHDSLFEYCGDADVEGQQRVVNIYKSDYCQVFDNTFLYSSNQSVFVNDGFKNSISRNTIKHFYYWDSPAIELYLCNDTLIQDNVLVDGLAEGISIWTSAYTICTGNYIGAIGDITQLQQAIILNQNATYNIVSDNIINGTYGIGAGGNGHGIYVFQSSHNIISNNILVNIGDSPIAIQGAGAIYASYNQVYGNEIHGGYQRYGIELLTNAEYTDLTGGNRIISSGLGRINPVISTATTLFPSVVAPFIHGGDEVLTGKINGFKVDGVDDNCTAWGTFPNSIQKSVRIKVYAVNLAYEADARLMNLTMYAGKGNEPILTSETVIIANEASIETGVAGNDVISWVFSSVDDGDIDDLGVGDMWIIIAQYSPAVGVNGATNCVFGVVVYEYI